MKKFFNPWGAARLAELRSSSVQRQNEGLITRLRAQEVRSGRFEVALNEIAGMAGAVASPNGTTRKLARVANTALAV